MLPFTYPFSHNFRQVIPDYFYGYYAFITQPYPLALMRDPA
jgi:hypothetical protein